MTPDEGKDFKLFLRNDQNVAFPFKHYTGTWTCQDVSHPQRPPLTGHVKGKARGVSAVVTIPPFSETGRHFVQILLAPRVISEHPPLVGEFYLQVEYAEVTSVHPDPQRTPPPAKKRRLS